MTVDMTLPSLKKEGGAAGREERAEGTGIRALEPDDAVKTELDMLCKVEVSEAEGMWGVCTPT